MFSLILMLLLAGGSPNDPTGHREALSDLSFLAGNLTATFETYSATWGEDHTGEALGSVSAAFGPGNQWLEMVAQTDLPGSGAYAVRVILYPGSEPGMLEAFVVNSFGSHATYTGHLVNQATLIFEADFGTKIQRIRYEQVGEQVRYYADESVDGGVTYHPHTESWWSPVQAPRIAHIEIPAAGSEDLTHFYTRAFGWRFDVLPDETGAMNYWLATAGEVGSDDVTAGIYQRTSPEAQPRFTIYVDDIHHAVDLVLTSGGYLDSPIVTVPASGHVAYVSDPDGNHFALFSAIR